MALERLLDTTGATDASEALYASIEAPAAPDERPYIFINVAATADGKIVLGTPSGSAAGVGGPTDQLLFRRIQRNCDAALIGSGTLRASTVIYPPEILRFVVTRSGDVPLTNRFFADAPDRAFVVAPEDLSEEAVARLRAVTNLLQCGTGAVDFAGTLKLLRERHGVRRLLCEGGAEVNEALLRLGVVDELFLTIAPKLKGGTHLPTPVGGEGFSLGAYLPLELLSVYRDGSELYLRYRVGAGPEKAVR